MGPAFPSIFADEDMGGLPAVSLHDVGPRLRPSVPLPAVELT